MTSTQLIAQLGETDQQFLQQNSPELALQRVDIRLQLIDISQQKQEKIYFLQQAIAILEQARLEFEDMPLSLYLDLSILLGRAYMLYFDLTQEQKFAIITEQIIKPLAHHEHYDLYQLLMQSSAAQNKPAMLSHWTQKAQKVMPAQSLIYS